MLSSNAKKKNTKIRLASNVIHYLNKYLESKLLAKEQNKATKDAFNRIKESNFILKNFRVHSNQAPNIFTKHTMPQLKAKKADGKRI